jgi:rfaE bifunctional protein nucleotidyltransferase chain/domain
MSAVCEDAAGGGLTIWFTGSTSAGVTNIAEAVCEALQAGGKRVEVLNGEDIRRSGSAAELTAHDDLIAVVVAASPYRDLPGDVRRRIGRFVEVYVHSSMPPSIDPLHEPLVPAIYCDTGHESVEQSVAKVLRAVEDGSSLPSRDPQCKVLSYSQVDDWVRAERAAGRRVGFTCGSFDLLHAGHVQYLAKARAHCDRLLVAVNSDESVRRYKSPFRPINPERERMYLVAALAAVDAVTILHEDRPLSLLLRWKPDLYIKGGDYKASSLQSAAAVEQYGGRVLLIPSEFATSTSAMLERIAAIASHAAPEHVSAEPARGLVLLDRDGTLIRDVPFLHDPTLVELLPGVGEGLAALQAAGFALAIVTNQQGIGLGYYTTQQFIAVNQQLFRALAPFGVRIAKIYHCPHHAAEQCACRKPESGMVKRALRELQIPAARTFLIGDTAADVAAAKTEGCRAVYVGRMESCPADYCAADFTDAVRWILHESAE